MSGRPLGNLQVKVGGDPVEYFRNGFPVSVRARLGKWARKS